MRKYAGASLVVLGIILSAPDGSMDRPLLIGGILSGTAGLSLTSTRKHRA